MRNHEDGSKFDKKRIDQDWRTEGKIAASYVEPRDEFVEMVTEIEWMLGGNVGLSDVAKDQIELSMAGATQMHF